MNYGEDFYLFTDGEEHKNRAKLEHE